MNNKDCYYYDLEEMKQYEDVKYISKGKVDGNIIHKVLESCNKYFHIEIQYCIYDDADLTEQVWVDVEGVDYGWLWMKNEDNKQAQHDVLVSKIKGFMTILIANKYKDDVYYVHMDTEEGECIRFYNQSNNLRVYNYRFSHNEIMF